MSEVRVINKVKAIPRSRFFKAQIVSVWLSISKREVGLRLKGILVYSRDRNLCKKSRLYFKKPTIKYIFFGVWWKQPFLMHFPKMSWLDTLKRGSCNRLTYPIRTLYWQWKQTMAKTKIKQDGKLAVVNCGRCRQWMTKGNLSWKSPLILQTFHTDNG